LSIGAKLAPPRPTRAFGEARARFDVLSARDGPEISAAGRSRFYEHGHRTARAVVLLHGLTNAPEQWARFAAELHRDGDTVVVPRFPGHGYTDRTTHAIARVGADEMLATAADALDIACGAGENVILAGLSIGGAISAWLSLVRSDVPQSLAISPFIGIANCNGLVNRVVTATLAALPNLFVPWDPGGDGSQIPPYGYAKFPTRLLAACLDIGLDALRRSSSQAPRGRLDFILNGHEPACNNDLPRALAARVTARRPDSATLLEWYDLPAVHDIIDPTNPHARTGLVYPRLRALIDPNGP
jgi:pimeloyl-ACP methyl ester carboxylesterase